MMAFHEAPAKIDRRCDCGSGSFCEAHFKNGSNPQTAKICTECHVAGLD
jgi:hypothetical protein